MFDRRHCTQKDLDLLNKETNRIKEAIALNDYSGLDAYLSLIERFDFDIANHLRRQIEINDSKIIVSLIDRDIDILKQNIFVDIYEHNRY